jgi:hypothetical protein
VERTSISYRDVTSVAPAVIHFPEWVVALENLGFVRLGRVQTVLHPDGIEGLAGDYEPDDRDRLIAAEQVPTVVLAAPDGSAFADVDWFWGGPSVRIRTLSTDGRLVSTHRAWEFMPAWPVKLQRATRFRTLMGEQRLSEARGRSLEIVRDADAATLWEAHRAHLTRVRATPEPHDTVAGYIRLSERAIEHELRSAERMPVASLAVEVAVLAVLLTLALVLVPAASSALGGVGVLVSGIGLAWVLQFPIVAWVRYVPWIRPRFR